VLFWAGLKHLKNIFLGSQGCSTMILDVESCKLAIHMTFDTYSNFSYVHAPHSQERLRITREMFMFLLTYHQVMPSFLDFIFPFGRQNFAETFHFSGFYPDERISTHKCGIKLAEIGRSGQDVRMCYSLRSVEAHLLDDEWPWSIRCTALYHSFDVEAGSSFWIFIKTDLLMKAKLEAATQADSPGGGKGFLSAATAFSSSLQMHLLLFDWCREHWRWYIDFLEKELQKSTRLALLLTFETSQSQDSTIARSRGIKRAQGCSDTFSPASYVEKGENFHNESAITKTRRFFCPAKKKTSPPKAESSPTNPAPGRETQAEEFTFKDLQRVHFLEENANEVVLVLESNIKIITEITAYYQNLLLEEDFPDNLRQDCRADIKQFTKNATSTVNDLEMQASATKTLLRILSDRRALVG
jgi:hypothetical protein